MHIEHHTSNKFEDDQKVLVSLYKHIFHFILQNAKNKQTNKQNQYKPLIAMFEFTSFMAV